MKKQYVLGADFGTDSVRTILVDAANGQELASALFYYPRWKAQLYCDAAKNQFRQHPLDYVEGLEATIRQCLQQAGPDAAAAVVAISVDTTGSTPVITDRTGTPLGLLPAFRDNPNAQFILWKDHTAVQEAAEINRHAARYDINYLQYVGGVYSSEWFWAKLLHVLRRDEAVRKAAWSVVEHCDWIPFLLTGGTDVAQLRRGVCAAGHKALWAENFHGLPPNEFFSALDPLLKDFTLRLFSRTYTCAEAAGNLSPEWAKQLGLSTDVVVGVGAFDAHMGAVGGQIEPYHLCKIMGTSTCDILVAPTNEVGNKLVQGICGQVPGSVIPGMIGMEAGQSAFGDAYAWFRQVLAWPVEQLLTDSSLADAHTRKLLKTEILDGIIPALSQQAAALPLEEEAPIAIDWFNGRRTPDANQWLKGALTGISLGADAPRLFRSIVEATCFGARTIVERFTSEGIPVNGVIGMGGVAKKSPFIMQLLADILEMPIRIHRSEQTCAAGAAMFAATAAGIYPTVEAAMAAMGQGFERTYEPDPSKAAFYRRRYQRYLVLGSQLEEEIMSRHAPKEAVLQNH
ncbi:MAG: ribulokinase [Candidatus Pseudobacter hemicellulosilyticus]|uniref:Ribulokinase n=1 Tax=Candidatus Pseudobacter hemicellulosilyticus TaxID=3121375 RepID=A0AAJ5WQ22_9BACT|nr:MAG: ribulokinase [Pseudobacter sp.]